MVNIKIGELTNRFAGTPLEAAARCVLGAHLGTLSHCLICIIAQISGFFNVAVFKVERFWAEI
jgi:hypothetical protein